ncbi:YbhB/YbcL family Raf kinase inhibitor-like protein [Formosa algae]|uniref:Phosphatidylethanolamine-binding protein (PEBP) family uncharacterized protein n=1 Tax=Formosa algae TaxID=225843 RepID=A0A9X0YJJ7_9FLAO|nr:hypothetical protein [Formosa algae]MBP1840007.1 phosphatidylethanolamine-binding protein (PEBP) family uncharacterized protein [Formosa algae]MDQ0335606.1 phosphatidylethanolamine-binding protein (PEBP) family uncharacterized protein [Formosa algae]OEI81701.1 hypothetical protein AST99_02100 [Formosa algae]
MKINTIVPIAICVLVLLNSCAKPTKDVPYMYDDYETKHSDFTVQSEAIVNGNLLDAFKCEKKIDDVEHSIPLSWSYVPEGTGSLAIVMYHYPKKEHQSEINSYLLLWGIEPTVSEIPYKMANSSKWFMGSNKDGTAVSYTSPCSHGPGKHEYIIKVFALSEMPESLPKSNSLAVDLNTFMSAISKDNIIDITSLIFTDTKN